MSRQIFANYDFDGIYVYQAFKPSIVEAALEKGTFGKGFGLDRMTWIKPSTGGCFIAPDMLPNSDKLPF